MITTMICRSVVNILLFPFRFLRTVFDKIIANTWLRLIAFVIRQPLSKQTYSKKEINVSTKTKKSNRMVKKNRKGRNSTTSAPITENTSQTVSEIVDENQEIKQELEVTTKEDSAEKEPSKFSNQASNMEKPRADENLRKRDNRNKKNNFQDPRPGGRVFNNSNRTITSKDRRNPYENSNAKNYEEKVKESRPYPYRNDIDKDTPKDSVSTTSEFQNDGRNFNTLSSNSQCYSRNDKESSSYRNKQSFQKDNRRDSRDSSLNTNQRTYGDTTNVHNQQGLAPNSYGDPPRGFRGLRNNKGPNSRQNNQSTNRRFNQDPQNFPSCERQSSSQSCYNENKRKDNNAWNNFRQNDKTDNNDHKEKCNENNQKDNKPWNNFCQNDKTDNNDHKEKCNVSSELNIHAPEFFPGSSTARNRSEVAALSSTETNLKVENQNDVLEDTGNNVDDAPWPDVNDETPQKTLNKNETYVDDYWDSNDSIPQNNEANSNKLYSRNKKPNNAKDEKDVDGYQSQKRNSNSNEIKRRNNEKHRSSDNNNWRIPNDDIAKDDNADSKEFENRENDEQWYDTKHAKKSNKDKKSNKFGNQSRRDNLRSTKSLDPVESKDTRNLLSNKTRRSDNFDYFNHSYDEALKDKEYKEFMEDDRGEDEFTNVKEEFKDLFTVSDDYSLGHCVAEDFNMGSGIAVAFRRKWFKEICNLLDQKQKAGGLAFIQDNKRFIYYMVTKKQSNGKPTYYSFWSSLKKLRDHIKENGVKKLAIPRIGCGLDRLEWSRVKRMIAFLFRDIDVEILVCNFQEKDDAVQTPSKIRNCQVKHENYPLNELEDGSIFVYLTSEDGFVTEEIEELNKKSNFLQAIKSSNKVLGKIIIHTDNNNLYCGCVIKRKHTDPFNFVQFQSCINEIQAKNRKERYEYVGIQAVDDVDDDLLNEKIINILRNTLRDVSIYVCYPKSLQTLIPKDRRSNVT